MPVGTCQYCGRAFCAGHGERENDGQEVCARKRCRQKKADVALHLEYKARVARRNAAGLCGQEGCETRYGGQCSKCKGFFCMAHVAPREETVRKGLATVSRMAAMCDHCWRRRPLWSRM
jgi:hypothetical protein